MSSLQHLTETARKSHVEIFSAIFDEIEKDKNNQFRDIPWVNRENFTVSTSYGRSSVGPSFHNHDLTTHDGQSSLLSTCSAVILEHVVCAKHNKRKNLTLNELQPWLNIADLLRQIV